MSIPVEVSDSESIVDQMIHEYANTIMPVPDIEHQPHLLISKVRKHYMEYIINLLSINYENNQRRLNRSVYLPSAIWRCAKNIEMSAAQTCMVVQLYRNNIVAEIKELKKYTKEGKLYRKLYDYLQKPPQNEKISQTTDSRSSDCICQCTCNQRKKCRRSLKSAINQNVEYEVVSSNSKIMENSNEKIMKPEHHILQSNIGIENLNKKNSILSNPMRISVELQDSDDLMQQMEKLFQSDCNDDDLFDGALCDIINSSTCDDNSCKTFADDCTINTNVHKINFNENIEGQKSLDERLATFTGILVNSSDDISQKSNIPRNKRRNSSKWLCEEYFQKLQLFKILDELSDCNRSKLERIKEILTRLFGEDSDEEEVMSPLEETSDFIISCKERVAPWVVKVLTPYYKNGRIIGKSLFKAVAKHLIRLIYQCSKYPHEYEVKSFVNDFLENHKMIRCEADFQQFQIKNI